MGKLDVVSQSHLLIFHHGEGVSQAKNGGGLSAQQVNVTGQGIRHEMAEVAILVGVRSQGKAQIDLIQHLEGGVRQGLEARRHCQDRCSLQIGGEKLKAWLGGPVGTASQHQSGLAQIRIEQHVGVVLHHQPITQGKPGKAAQVEKESISLLSVIEVVDLVQQVFQFVPFIFAQADALVE